MSPVTANKSPALRVLVVDDEALIRWSLSESFTDEGYEVVEASDGASAVAQASGTRAFDAIVLDYRLPDSNDLLLLARIRELQPTAAVVMMTAFGTQDVTTGAITLGAYRVVAKPFDVHDMVNLVAEAYRASRDQHKSSS